MKKYYATIRIDNEFDAKYEIARGGYGLSKKWFFRKVGGDGKWSEKGFKTKKSIIEFLLQF